jgi:hypothetical protein
MQGNLEETFNTPNNQLGVRGSVIFFLLVEHAPLHQLR